MARASLTDPLTPLNVQPVGLAGFGDPIFSDEFQGTTWDSSKWIPWYPDTPFWNATSPGGHKTNTNEPQGYDSSGLSVVSDSSGSFLRMTLRASNAAVPELSYTSGMICSYPSFNPTYGCFEARMRLPNKLGSWPAFWMDRTDQVWPPEIDWMENWGKDSYNTQTGHAYHYLDGSGTHVYTNSYKTYPQDVGGAWHTFGGIWESGRIRWLVDGVVVKDYQASNVNSQPMYLICNLAGDPANVSALSSRVPFSVDVDYIRAWSLNGSNVDNPSSSVEKFLYDSSGSRLTPYLLSTDGSNIPLKSFLT